MTPILLRRAPTNDSFYVVGESYIYGIMDGESLLGPLPPSWKVRVELNGSIMEPRYLDTERNIMVREDPRLENLPAEWERIEQQRTADDPIMFAPHRNKSTGEIINWDPRMSPENLRARGINLQTFRLV